MFNFELLLLSLNGGIFNTYIIYVILKKKYSQKRINNYIYSFAGGLGSWYAYYKLLNRLKIK